LPGLMNRLYATNVVVLLSIITGNWLYIAYRAPDGAMQWFLTYAPNAHYIVMEFKEFVSLFPLPLGVAASVILLRYKQDIAEQPEIRNTVAVLLTLMWLCLMVGFVFGIGLAKLRLA
jgi:hypothetical protein